MPELPEVETVRRGLLPVLEGHRLVRVAARRPDLRFPLPRGFAARLQGRRVERLSRRGKYLLASLDDGATLLIHLGMSGRLRRFGAERPPFEAHDHVVFETDAGCEVRFCDPRRFGFMDWIAPGGTASHPMLAVLGPDPLGDEFTAAFLAGRLAGRAAPLKAAILEQSTVAGMGNIYASESLYRAGFSPRRRSRTIAGRRAERLVHAIKAVFADAIAAGGSSLRDHRQPTGELGYFQHRFAVYGREGLPCPECDCDVTHTGGIRRAVLSGRSTFFCAKRQR